jgi:uncharacterized protein (DUF305 family)
MTKAAARICSVSFGLLLASGWLLSSCRGGTDDGRDAHPAQVPASMMAALHTMAQHSEALPAGDNLDLYFARLMRENHQAAVTMSALELQQGRDPALRALARDIHHTHQLLVLGLDSAIARIRALPPSYPEHTSQSHQLVSLLDAATKGLHPAAHRMVAGDDSGQVRPGPPGPEDALPASTGRIDRDYAALLVPHHQNSMALARAELQLGRDEQLQRAAYLVLLDQQREIDQVQAWLRQDSARTN